MALVKVFLPAITYSYRLAGLRGDRKSNCNKRLAFCEFSAPVAAANEKPDQSGDEIDQINIR